MSTFVAISSERSSSSRRQVTGIKRAVADVGVEKLDGEAVYQALQTIKDFAPGTMLPVTFDAERRDGCRHQLLYQIRDGQFHLLTPLDEPIDGGDPHPRDILAAAGN